MNAYWMNELVHEGTTCPMWLAITLGVVVVGFVVGVVIALIKA